jgi:hypothetical protein
MGLKRVLSGRWFSRAVLIAWIISAVSIFVLLRDIELIVHGQLYYYGLRFSADWADPYRAYTWLIFVCLGVPFSRPLVMLDFASGKPKLVNVCPYCNHLLSSTENEKGANGNIHVTNVDEKLTHH